MMIDEIEIWKDVIGFEGLYLVSNLGKIKSLPKICLTPTTSYMRGEMLMSMHPNKKGYLSVGLSKNKCYHTRRVHRIVAEAFIPNPNNLPEVNHKYGDKLDNRASSLEWTTGLDNIRHSWVLGLRGSNIPKGKNHYASKVVVDLNTGIFYDSIIEAAFAKGMRYNHLSRQLSGNRSNRTSMVYA